jgi:outer membrane protein assembly factor BamB
MIALLAAAALAQAEWPTYHGGYSLDGAAREAPPEAPARLWRFRGEGRILGTPVAGGGRIYAATLAGNVYALDAAGAQLWKVQVAKEEFEAPPLYADGALVVGSLTGTLTAFDAATGQERWKAALDDTIQGSPNRVELPGGTRAVIAVAQSDGSIHCVDLATGKPIWKTAAVERCDGSAGVGGGRVVMGSCASALHVFGVEKGEKAADIDLGADCQVAGGVAMAGAIAYAGSRGGKVFAADTAAARLLWTNGEREAEVFTTPAVGERLVIFGARDGKVFALDRATGAKAWEVDAGAKPSSPILAGNRVALSAGGSLLILEAESGKRVWSAKVSDEITSPAAVGGRLIVGADDGTVTAFGKP